MVVPAIAPAGYGSALPVQQPSGLLDMLFGRSNPVAQFADSNRSLLGAIGSGLAQGQNFGQGLAAAAQGAPAARNADTQRSMYLSGLNSTYNYLSKSHPELAQAVATGAMSPSDAFAQAMKLDHPAPVSIAPGGSLVNPITGATIARTAPNAVSLAPGAILANPQTGAQIGANTGNGGFYSTDMRSQAWNTVMRANAPGADPALKDSPAFRASWAIVSQPTMTPQGIVEPQLPDNWGPAGNTAGNSAPAPVTPQMSAPQPAGVSAAAPGTPPVTPTSASVSDMSMIAPAANAQFGHGIVPGTQPFNQSQARTTMLTQSAIPDLKRVIDGFPALMNTKDQILAKFGDLGRVAQDPAYKQTTDAMTSAMGNILYVASGANLNAGELQRKVQAYMPAIGDDPQTAVNKLDRFANDVMTQANSTKDETTIRWAEQAVQGIKQTEKQMLAGQQSPAPQTVPAGTPIWGPDGKQYVMGPHGAPVPVM